MQVMLCKNINLTCYMYMNEQVMSYLLSILGTYDTLSKVNKSVNSFSLKLGQKF